MILDLYLIRCLDVYFCVIVDLCVSSALHHLLLSDTEHRIC